MTKRIEVLIDEIWNVVSNISPEQARVIADELDRRGLLCDSIPATLPMVKSWRVRVSCECCERSEWRKPQDAGSPCNNCGEGVCRD